MNPDNAQALKHRIATEDRQSFDKVVSGRYMFSLQVHATATDVGESPEGDRIDLLYLPRDNAPTWDLAPAYTLQTPWTTDWDKNGTKYGALITASGGLSEFRTILGYLVADLTPPTGPLLDAYEKEKVNFRKLADEIPSGSPPDIWLGFDAKLVSGSDWVLIRTDGVAELSGTFAFKSIDLPDEALVAMEISGSVSLGQERDKSPRDRFVEAIKQPSGGLHFAAAATFEAGLEAPSWAPDRLKRQAAGFWKYAQLTRSEFLAVGDVTTKDLAVQGDTYSITVNVDIYQVLNAKTPATLDATTAKTT
jgi:hypothetical protein